MQDAYNLGWKLGHVLRHGAPDALLDSYEAERLPVAAHLLEFVVQMHKDWLGKAKDKEEPRKGEHMQLGLNYRGGPLSVDERPAVGEGVTRAGDRAPDARLDGRRRRAACGCSMCCAGRISRCWRWAARPCRRSARSTAMRCGCIASLDPRPPAAGALIDGDGQVHRIYGDGLILVRPDGYLGYTGPGGGAGLSSLPGRFFG